MHLDNLLDDLVPGEARTLPYTVEDMDDLDGDSLAKAYLTVKKSVDDPDSAAIFQRVITPDLTDNGQIDEVGGGSPVVDGHLFFLLPADVTILAKPDIFYAYDVKAFSSGGAPKVVDGGYIRFRARVTRADS